FSATVRGDARFFALVFPQVIRQILERALRESTADDQEAWRGRWLLWAQRLPGVIGPPEFSSSDEQELTEAQLEWIDDVVGSFCDQKTTLDRWNSVAEG